MNRLRIFMAVMAVIVLISACGRKDPEVVPPAEETVTEGATVEPEDQPIADPDPEPVEEETQEPEEDEVPVEPEVEEIDLTGMAINPLTGLYIHEEVVSRRAIGVMINNHSKALPQSGLAQADIIYETLVEGGIARLLAIYKDFDADKIGPIRSARHYYLDFTFDHDALYVHYGQSPQADVAISNLNAPNMNGLGYLDTVMCFQDPERVRPHSTYVSYDGLMAAWDREKYRTTHNDGFVNKFNFSKEPLIFENGQSAEKVTLDYSYYQYAWFDYAADTEKYMRNQFKGPHVDVETGEQLSVDNIIVQIADIWVIKGDTEGRLNVDLVSKGEGYYISKGVAIPITWSKNSHYDPTQYYMEDGSPLLMNPGKTWISVFPSYRPEGLIIE